MQSGGPGIARVTPGLKSNLESALPGGQSILRWQGVQPSKIKTLALWPGSATAPMPRNIPVISFSSRKLKA